MDLAFHLEKWVFWWRGWELLNSRLCSHKTNKRWRKSYRTPQRNTLGSEWSKKKKSGDTRQCTERKRSTITKWARRGRSQQQQYEARVPMWLWCQCCRIEIFRLFVGSRRFCDSLGFGLRAFLFAFQPFFFLLLQNELVTQYFVENEQPEREIVKPMKKLTKWNSAFRGKNAPSNWLWLTKALCTTNNRQWV